MIPRLLRVFGGAAVTLALVAVPSSAEELEAALDVTIEDLQPQVLQADRDLTIRGTVRNSGSESWTDVRAHVVVARNPFTLHHELDTAYEEDRTGSGRVLPGQEVELGNVDAQESRPFSITVEYDDLGLLGAEGVYPIGVRLSGTGPDGEESNAGSASSLVPLLEDDPVPVATTVLTQFTSTAVDPATEPRALVEDLARLERLTASAASIPRQARSLTVDVALLDGLKALGADEPLALEILEGIVDLADDSDTHLTRYAQPDEAVLVTREAFLGATRRATREVADRHALSAPTIARLEPGTLTADLLARTTADVLLVPHADVPDHTRADGQVLRAGGVGLVVSQQLPGPGWNGSAVIVRQRILADAALTNFTRRLDPAARGTVVTILPAEWDPGTAPARLGAAFRSALLDPATISAQRGAGESLTATLPRSGNGSSVSPQRVRAAETLLATGEELVRVVSDPSTLTRDVDRQVAAALSVRWDDADGLEATLERTRSLRAAIDAVSLTGPRTVTLSGRTGSFPVTVSNDSAFEVEVGVDLTPSNGAVTVASIEPVTIGPDERRTVTVEVDMAEQQSTIMTAHLQTADATRFGSPEDFNVRASNVGNVVWASLGVAALGFVLTVARRFRRRGLRS